MQADLRRSAIRLPLWPSDFWKDGHLPAKPASEGRSMEPNTPTGGEKLIQCLEREGIEYIFGLSGGAAMPMFDALVDSKIQLILTRHEQGATHMADGYARSTGRPGVVLVTSGPGATNTVTGLLTALMDSSPIIVHLRPDHLADARQGRLPGGRRHRHHLPGREALLSREATPTTSRASCARPSTSPQTGRPGAGADRHARRTSARGPARRPSPTSSICPATQVPTAAAIADAIAEAARFLTESRSGHSSTWATAPSSPTPGRRSPPWRRSCVHRW